MNLGVHKEESVSAKIQNATMNVIEKHFHGEATQDVSAALDTFPRTTCREPLGRTTERPLRKPRSELNSRDKALGLKHLAPKRI